MKFWLMLLTLFFSISLVWAEFKDPMRPPPYALEKFRIEKLKLNGSVNKKVIKPIKKVTWELNSILFSGQRKHAIINNQLVKKGEMIKGAKLIRLNHDSVQLLSKGKIIDLKIYADKKNFKSIKKSLSEKKI